MKKALIGFVLTAFSLSATADEYSYLDDYADDYDETPTIPEPLPPRPEYNWVIELGAVPSGAVGATALTWEYEFRGTYSECRSWLTSIRGNPRLGTGWFGEQKMSVYGFCRPATLEDRPK